jgi:hypothetical protein
MKLSVPEILEQVVAAGSKAEKIATLQKYNNPTLQTILRLNFDANAELALPEGAAPYNAKRDIPVELSDSNLYNEARRLYIFEKGNPKYNPDISKLRREALWIQILEGIHHTEADLLNQVKDKKLSSVYKGLTEALVREAFPGLITEKVSKK